MSIETKTTEPINPEGAPESKTIEIPDGHVTYSVLGQPNSEHHPVIWFSASGNDRVNMADVGKIIANEGHRQVLVLDQPVWNKNIKAAHKLNTQAALDFQAEAFLTAALDAGLIGEGKVVDVAAHSFGAQIFERAKQLAKEKGITSFDQDQPEGSRIALLGPAGSNAEENIGDLMLRYTTRYLPRSSVDAKILDPTGKNGEAVLNNARADLPKTLGEVWAMANRRIDYEQLGEALVVVYPEDKAFPENQKAVRGEKSGLIYELMSKELPISIVTPVNPDDVVYKGLNLWLTKFWLKGLKARLEFARSSRGAGHNDPTDNPARTAKVLLHYFDRV